MMRRREFLEQGMFGTAGLCFAPKAGWNIFSNSRTADSRIDVLFDEPLGTTSPNIYGHFAENLGPALYDGISVGEKSRVRNTTGLGTEPIEDMRRFKAPTIRYPCG